MLEWHLEKMLKDGVIEEYDGPCYGVAHIAPKPSDPDHGRFVVDTSSANAKFVRGGYPMKDARDVRHRSKGKKCFLSFDGYQGYHQVPLTEEASRLLTFTSPRGSYRYLRGTMGTPGMPQHFQRVMSEEVLHGLDGRICDVFVDDVPVYGTRTEKITITSCHYCALLTTGALIQDTMSYIQIICPPLLTLRFTL